MFLNPFLAKLPDEARENLCRRMSIQTINRDHTIYRQGEEVSNFYLILSGEPFGCHNTKQPSSRA